MHVCVCVHVCKIASACLARLLALQSLARAVSGSVMRGICNQGLNTITKVRWPRALEGVEAWKAEEERWRGDKLIRQVADVAVRDARGGDSPLSPSHLHL